MEETNIENINWIEVFKQWTPSSGSVKIEDSSLLEGIENILFKIKEGQDIKINVSTRTQFFLHHWYN